jgi:hypothetical protein
MARAGRVEERDVAGAASAVSLAGEHGAELGHVIASHASRAHARGELAAETRLLPADPDSLEETVESALSDQQDDE